MNHEGTAREISLGDDFGEVIIKVNGATIEVLANGSFAAPSANDCLVQKALEVGDRLRDGTVCIAVDLNKKKALFAPAGIIGGNAKFDYKHEIPEQLNQLKAHGHDDWRNITDDEGKTLSEVWDKAAPDKLKGAAAPWFWLASPYSNGFLGAGRVRRGGHSGWRVSIRSHSLPVPVVRSGPVSP